MWIYGKQPVLELVKSNHPLKQIVLSSDILPAYERSILSYIVDRNVGIQKVKKAHLQRFCGPVLHQGAIALIDEFKHFPEPSLLELIETDLQPLILVLDQIQDPHNLGAIIRTAEAAGVNAVILPQKGSSAITPTVVKTSAGAVFHQKICYCMDLFSMLSQIRQTQIRVFALMPGTDKKIYQINLKGPIALVIGSEGKGVRKNVLKFCDERISLPLKGQVKSLNVSVATAVSIYEILRQRLTE
jgi:23S rRNA (guanosine2251-2'-O)-methyltransferase